MNPFHSDGEWLKAALHTHSTVSDGTLAPDRLVQSYVEAGFDIVAISFTKAGRSARIIRERQGGNPGCRTPLCSRRSGCRLHRTTPPARRFL